MAVGSSQSIAGRFSSLLKDGFDTSIVPSFECQIHGSVIFKLKHLQVSLMAKSWNAKKKDSVIELTMRKPESIFFKEALLRLASYPGLQPLVPYFTYFIADEVSKNLNHFIPLFALMRVAWSLLQNRHENIEPYLHQMMPSVITYLVAKNLGNRLSDNHWDLRNFSANLLATICRYSEQLEL